MSESLIPFQSFGSKKDIVNIVVFLTPKTAKLFNGANWAVNRGQTQS